jgi:hypothetical protein
MPVQIPVSDKSRRGAPWEVPRGAIAILLCSGAALIVAVAWLLPRALVLPTVSVAAVLAAALTALIAWSRPRNPQSERVTYWDVAGALTLIGVCAALLSDPEAAIPLMESRQAQ